MEPINTGSGLGKISTPEGMESTKPITNGLGDANSGGSMRNQMYRNVAEGHFVPMSSREKWRKQRKLRGESSHKNKMFWEL